MNSRFVNLMSNFISFYEFLQRYKKKGFQANIGCQMSKEKIFKALWIYEPKVKVWTHIRISKARQFFQSRTFSIVFADSRTSRLVFFVF